MAQATTLREKEAAAFAKESADLKTNIAAIGKAVAALEKGAGGAAFLQTPAARLVKTWAMEKATRPRAQLELERSVGLRWGVSASRCSRPKSR